MGIKGALMQRVLLSLAVATVLAGCGDPLRDVPKLQDVEVNPAAGQADALADPVDAAIADVIGEARPEPLAEDKPRGGLLGFLGRLGSLKLFDGDKVGK